MEHMVGIPAGFLFVYITITISEMVLCFSRRVASVSPSKIMYIRKDKNRNYHILQVHNFYHFQGPNMHNVGCLYLFHKISILIRFHLNSFTLFISLQFVNSAYYYFDWFGVFLLGKSLKYLLFYSTSPPLQCSMLTKLSNSYTNHQCAHTNFHCRGEEGMCQPVMLLSPDYLV